jgi:hypothetical protein
MMDGQPVPYVPVAASPTPEAVEATATPEP